VQFGKTALSVATPAEWVTSANRLPQRFSSRAQGVTLHTIYSFTANPHLRGAIGGGENQPASAFVEHCALVIREWAKENASLHGVYSAPLGTLFRPVSLQLSGDRIN